MTDSDQNRIQLSTFIGVFTPNILTILGVILFLRMGFVVGNAGLKQALLILVFCHVVSIITSFSLAAIATNMSEVKGGGAYYLISRSIGIGNGGAIGIILYLAQTTSIALYVLGFSDVLFSLFPVLANFGKIVPLLILSLIFIPTFKGSDISSKFQLGILITLALSLMVFFYSAWVKFDPALLSANMEPNFVKGVSFWTMFALFFPAVTGFTQGVSLSGVLKNPQRSITIGTFLAVFVGFIIYVAGMVSLAGTASSQELLQNYEVMKTISFLPFMIIVGVTASTLSSALGSFMGAPYILQAFSQDKLLPFIDFFAKGSADKNEPQRAVIMTYLIAFTAILLANVNSIAPIISMFFLISYGMMNYATFIESYAKNPSFRPSFRWSHWSLSLSGVLFIGFVMVMIDWVAAAIAVVFLFGLRSLMERKRYQKGFKDARTGYYFQRIKELLIKLQNQPIELKNWRPQILVLSGEPTKREGLIHLGQCLESNLGVLSLLQVLYNVDGHPVRAKLKAEKELFKFIKEKRIKILGDVVVADRFFESIKTIIQTYGFHGVRPNTLLLGWSDKVGADRQDYIQLVRFANQLGKSILIFDGELEFIDHVKAEVVIDVWWRGQANGSLMLMFAHLIRRSGHFRKGKVRLLRIVEEEKCVFEARQEMEKLLRESRIPAEITIIVDIGHTKSLIMNYSRHSELVLMGVSLPEEKTADFLTPFAEYRQEFRNILLVKSSVSRSILD